MAVKTLFVDPSRCIGCRACEAACRECDSHKGESMVMVDFIDRGLSVATQPTVCMHCEDPVAPVRAGLPGAGDPDHARTASCSRPSRRAASAAATASTPAPSACPSSTSRRG